MSSPLFDFQQPEDEPDEPEKPERKPARKRRRDEEDEVEEENSRRKPQRSGLSGVMIAIVACAGTVLLIGAAVGGYFLIREPSKSTVKADPLKEAPKPTPQKSPLTPEQVIRKVKGSTVYVRVRTRDGISAGSGFFAGKPGYVVTNAHVVGYGPREIQVPIQLEVVVDSGELGERTVPVKLYGVDVDADLALLRLDERNLPPPLPLGKAESLTETQEVVIFGYPFGEALGKNVSINRTTVSSLRKTNGSVEVVQLAGGMNPGNSGGPVANAKGEVVGVSVAKLRGTDTIAFAIPAELAERFVTDQLKTGGEMRLGGLSPP